MVIRLLVELRFGGCLPFSRKILSKLLRIASLLFFPLLPPTTVLRFGKAEFLGNSFFFLDNTFLKTFENRFLVGGPLLVATLFFFKIFVQSYGKRRKSSNLPRHRTIEIKLKLKRPGQDVKLNLGIAPP